MTNSLSFSTHCDQPWNGGIQTRGVVSQETGPGLVDFSTAFLRYAN